MMPVRTMNFGLSCAFILLLSGTSVSFSPTARGTRNERSFLVAPLKMTEGGETTEFGAQVRSIFGAFGVVSAVLFSSIGAHAAGGPIPAMESSTVKIAAEIKTMDMSLPSSYNSISGATASGTAELTVVENVVTGTQRKAAPKKKDGGAMSASNFGKKMTDEEKATIAAEKQAQREAEAAEKVAIAADKAAEREALKAEKEALAIEKATGKAADRGEKEAERLVAKEAAKAIALKKAEETEAKKSERVFSGAEIVDMSMPSYADSASASGTKENFFSL